MAPFTALILAGAFGAHARPTTVYDFTVKNIDGKSVSLRKYHGKVLLIVNVASKCGHTPQYKGLEALFQDYHKKGFEVLGFPANDFMGQEPGTDAEIKQFCKSTYDVKFPMFSKIVVKGEGQHPLYQWLTTTEGMEGPIDWNFAKFLVGRDGRVVARFKSTVQPDSPEVKRAIEAATKMKS